MKPHLAVAIAAITLAPPCPARATLPTVNTPAPSSQALTSSQLDQLVAPIALYPDAVLTDILAASTYPAEVVEANRFATDPANNGLQGAALASAAARHDWDPSVVALLQFPQVVQMMDDNLEWTEHLGRAFMDQQTAVMDAVQTLRQDAERAGTLRNGPLESVVDDGGTIIISPPATQEIYLPTYDASCVYGPAPGCNAADDELGWGTGIFVPYGYWQWGGVDWAHRQIRFDRDGRGQLHASSGYGAGRLTRADGAVWKHTGPRNFGSYHIANFRRSGFGDSGGFQYAPSATQSLHGTGITGNLSSPAHFNTAPAFHPQFQHAAPHVAVSHVAVSHAGVVGVHR